MLLDTETGLYIPEAKMIKTVKVYSLPCPNCGADGAEYTVTRMIHDEPTGYYYTITCDLCEYKEADYNGPDY
jgi:C4-type Zn-finger protein